MAKYLDLPIIATMIASFAMTYAYLYRHGPPAPAASSVATATAGVSRARSRELPRVSLVSAGKLESPLGVVSEAASRQVPSGVAIAAASGDPPAASRPLPPLPVQISVFNRRQQNKIEGIVQNVSSEHLSLILRGRNEDGLFTSQTHLELDPEQRTTFGTDSGMALQERDDIVVQSPGYADMSSHVP